LLATKVAIRTVVAHAVAMGLLIDELGKPRWSGGGLMLIVVLCPLLLYPLVRNRDIDHPLSAEMRLDLCARLPAAPTSLPGPMHRVGLNENGNISCEFRDQDNAMTLVVMLMTTRTASMAGPVRTSAAYETWIKEVKASGAKQMRDETGPWAMAQSYRYGSNQQMLVEDHGVMISLMSPALDANDMAHYARDVAVALRKP
jgi:hypothetical protein